MKPILAILIGGFILVVMVNIGLRYITSDGTPEESTILVPPPSTFFRKQEPEDDVVSALSEIPGLHIAQTSYHLHASDQVEVHDWVYVGKVSESLIMWVERESIASESFTLIVEANEKETLLGKRLLESTSATLYAVDKATGCLEEKGCKSDKCTSMTTFLASVIKKIDLQPKERHQLYGLHVVKVDSSLDEDVVAVGANKAAPCYFFEWAKSGFRFTKSSDYLEDNILKGILPPFKPTTAKVTDEGSTRPFFAALSEIEWRNQEEHILFPKSPKSLTNAQLPRQIGYQGIDKCHIGFKRYSDSALIFGSGPSLSSWTEDQWKGMRKKVDIWGVNYALSNPWTIPDFWHVEPDNIDALKVLGEFFAYTKDTIMVCEQECFKTEYLGPAYTDIKRKFQYKRDSIQCSRECSFDDGFNRAHQKCRVHVDCCTSLNRVMEFLIQMGYKRIYFLGLDMGDKSRYWDPYRPGLNPRLKEYYQKIEKTSVKDTILWKGVNTMRTPDGHNAGDKQDQHWAGRMGLETYIPAYCLRNDVSCINLSQISTLKGTMRTQKVEDVVELFNSY